MSIPKFQTLQYDHEGEVAVIAFDHGKVNAMDPQMHRELYECLVHFTRDDRVKVGVLTSYGEKPFSVGEDIKTPRAKEDPCDYVWRHLNPHAGEMRGEPPGRPGWDWDILTMERTKPIIAAVQGWCLGQGILYMLHMTDIRVAADDAQFGFPEIAYGMGGVGGWMRLARQISHVHAMELVLTGDMINADRAASLNLINHVVPRANLRAEAMRIAGRIARHPALAIRTEMEAFYRGHDMTREQAIAFGAHLYRLQRLAAGEDALGGMLNKK
ncbi:carnitinyl-CoA dehydratase [Roseovarius sp. A-2]|uniref:enoyl-CoA hydratase/isomerase family protein n=1 Tax=Roseovarius sp. A-2 TaxID=1570360 RepID=UPI0009B56EC0|nr:enoyl-CoA hydratase/isomerase family protein [Roseovarius sp. A-2]GAW37092.1 carnitinyl-CoA dehydratase [Roseovarius sp. A-2]